MNGIWKCLHFHLKRGCRRMDFFLGGNIISTKCTNNTIKINKCFISNHKVDPFPTASLEKSLSIAEARVYGPHGFPEAKQAGSRKALITWACKCYITTVHVELTRATNQVFFDTWKELLQDTIVMLLKSQQLRKTRNEKSCTSTNHMPWQSSEMFTKC